MMTKASERFLNQLLTLCRKHEVKIYGDEVNSYCFCNDDNHEDKQKDIYLTLERLKEELGFD